MLNIEQGVRLVWKNYNVKFSNKNMERKNLFGYDKIFKIIARSSFYFTRNKTKIRQRGTTEI